MLRRVFEPQEQLRFQIPIGEANERPLFVHSPEFNPPAHGVWNIVHVGMLVPQSHQIYVCGVNCMRGVVLTAAEMDARERFSMVLLEERDLIDGSVERVTIEGVADVLERLPVLPPVVMVFTVCTHRFLACDLDYIYRRLGERFPGVRFLRCYMEPITQKRGLSPDQRLRRTMFELLPDAPVRDKSAAILGSDYALDPDADLRRMLASSGWELLEIQNYRTYQDMLTMGEAKVLFSIYPKARYGAVHNAERLGRQHYHLPASFSYAEIAAQEQLLAEELGLVMLDAEAERAACEEALAHARQTVADMEIVIDQALHPRPLGLARLLLSHGFAVTKVYMDAVTLEEHEDYLWLQCHYPALLLCATNQPERRVLPRDGGAHVLALGQIAAWAEGTTHFVNLVEGGGLWGYAGIRSMARLMEEAAMEEKDTAALVPRKGLGCACTI